MNKPRNLENLQNRYEAKKSQRDEHGAGQPGPYEKKLEPYGPVGAQLPHSAQYQDKQKKQLE